MDDDPQPPDGPDTRRTEALHDAEDDTVTATDVDPTGNAVRNEAVQKVEDAAHRSDG